MSSYTFLFMPKLAEFIPAARPPGPTFAAVYRNRLHGATRTCPAFETTVWPNQDGLLVFSLLIDYRRSMWPIYIDRDIRAALAHGDTLAQFASGQGIKGDDMPQIANPTLLGVGLLVLLLGIWMWRWSSRQVIDVKGLAIGAAWSGVKKGQIPNVPDDLKSKFNDIASQKTHAGKVKKAGGTVARHFIGQMVGIASFIAVLTGLGLMAAGIWWK